MKLCTFNYTTYSSVSIMFAEVCKLLVYYNKIESAQCSGQAALFVDYIASNTHQQIFLIKHYSTKYHRHVNISVSECFQEVRHGEISRNLTPGRNAL